MNATELMCRLVGHKWGGKDYEWTLEGGRWYVWCRRCDHRDYMVEDT